MSIRYYSCGIAGDGTIDNPFRPSVLGILVPDVQWKWMDCRVDETLATGEMLAWADVTPTQHSIINGVAGVTYIPFEDSGGNVLTINDPIGEIEASKRTQIQNALEARHVPMQGLQLTDEIYVILRRFISRCRIRQYLHEHDYTELLNNAVSSIPAAKRNAIRTKLEAIGFDLSGIVGSTTIREALRLLIVQDNVAF